MGHSWIIQESDNVSRWYWRCEKCGYSSRDLTEYVTTVKFSHQPDKPSNDATIWVLNNNTNDFITCEEAVASRVMES